MIIDGVRVNYGIIDQTIQDDTVTNNSSENSEYSDVDVTMQSGVAYDKITYLEKDYFRLDGTHVFPETGSAYNVGWESESLSDTGGNISEYIEYVFANIHDSYGVQIRFPDYCPADTFTIAYYNDNTLVGERTVTGNTATLYSNSDVRLNWNKVRLTFTKINPQQRARLWQITFGISDMYDENTLISVSASRATDLTGDYDDSGEFSFQFFNDGRFDIRTINDLPIGLQEGLKVTVYIRKRGSTTYVPFGNYYSETTDVAENGQVITVSGYDELYNLGDTTYRNGIVYPEGRSLYDWAEEVAEDAGIALDIDNAFASIISTGYITEVPHREALRLIAEAGNGMLVVDENGNISLKKHMPTEKGALTSDDIVEGGHSIENSDKYIGVNVTKYTFSAASAEQELGHLEEIGLTAEPQKIEIVYSEYPAVISTVQVFVDTTSSATITATKIYSDRCIITLTGTAGDTTFITVTGKPYNKATTAITRGSTAKNIKKIESNYLITGDIADDVADYQYEKVANKYKHTAEIVSNTDYDLGDHVEIDTENSAGNTRDVGGGQYITRVGFNISYEEHSETMELIDE